eukprot:1153884-Pelagomonas_calceolata.AAC.3
MLMCAGLDQGGAEAWSVCFRSGCELGPAAAFCGGSCCGCKECIAHAGLAGASVPDSCPIVVSRCKQTGRAIYHVHDNILIPNLFVARRHIQIDAEINHAFACDICTTACDNRTTAMHLPVTTAQQHLPVTTAR